jgi:hypothetical protein
MNLGRRRHQDGRDSRSAGGAERAPPLIACTRCGWRPPAGTRNVRVSNIDELERALNDAHPGDAVLLANGDYPIRRMLDIRVPNVTLRGEKGRFTARVVLHGRRHDRRQRRRRRLDQRA